MTTRTCKGCGSELFDAQRFCRACGRPTDELPSESAPTQMMPPQPETWGARSSANTAPASRQETAPVTEQPAYYQTQLPPMQQSYAPPPAFVPPGRRSPVGWILAFIGIAVFAGLIFAVMFVARLASGHRGRFPVDQTSSAQAGETALSDGSADRVEKTGSQKTMIKTFSLGADPKLTLRGISGSIMVTSWDNPQAEVRVTTKRETDQVFFKTSGSELSIRTGSNASGDIRYEIKVPKEMSELNLKMVNGGIRVADIEGDVVAESANSSVELVNIAGEVTAKTTNGAINVILSEWRDDDVSLKTVNGTINLQIKGDVNAELDAKTVQGSIQIDDSFGVPVERKMVGQTASGKIGVGGKSISLGTVNGSIRLSK